MKIVFFGTTEFVIPILEALAKKYEVVLVVCESAKPQGRQNKIIDLPVAAYAKANNLNLLTPDVLNKEVIGSILSYQADIFIVAAYGKILPVALIDSPKFKSLNIHPSLLPKFRGPTPTQTAILEGLTETGVSLMVLNEGMDQGPILVQEKEPILESDNYLTLEAKLFKLGGEMLINNLEAYVNGKLKPKPQDDSEATYTKLLKRADGQIDWSKMSANQVYNIWRAYINWPGIFTFFKNKNGQDVRLKLIKIEKYPTSDVGYQSGEIFIDEAKNLYIACREGVIKIIQLQPENSKILTVGEFLNGYSYVKSVS